MNRLIRISFGPFQLLDLKPGEVEPVQRRVLVDQLGARIARELGLTERWKTERRAAQGAQRASASGKP